MSQLPASRASSNATTRSFDAVVFDMDGVVTRTAAVHALAWKRMFDEFLERQRAEGRNVGGEFTRADYLKFVDGRPRYRGVECFLASRGIELPHGAPDDSPGAATIRGLGNRKNAHFNALVTEHGVALFDSTIALIHELRAQGIAVGLATSSRNAALVLASAGVANLFATAIDGIAAESLHLNGKPAPDIFLRAARDLGADPARTVIVEDAVSGVQAGAGGEFGLVIGIARENNRSELREHGADLVVGDLAETSLCEIDQAVQRKRAGARRTVPSVDPRPMRKKPLLGFWQLWNMSFGYIGIQFGFALQNSNVSRIFGTLGAAVADIPILWIAAPVSGLLVQPIIGYLSDRTWTRLGRRKPYFLVGALLASFALLFMPNSPTLWIAAGMLWIMDASINVTMEPMRAFVGDMLADEQRTTGFAVQTFFIGVSSVVGSLMPYLLTNVLHVANTAPAGKLPPSVKWSFYSGGVVYLLAVLWTIVSTKEYSPEEQREFNASESMGGKSAGDDVTLDTRKYTIWGVVLVVAGFAFSAVIREFGWDKGLYILSFGACSYGALQIIAAARYRAGRRHGLVELMYDFNNMPTAMRQLALAQMATWFALFAFFIYSTAAVTSYHYGASDPTTDAYNTGANWVGVLNAVYNGVAALAAPFLPLMARKLNRVKTHIVCLIIGGLGLASMAVFRAPHLLIVSMIGLGIAWASLLTLPYAILSSVVPFQKMGVYMGMFNFFIVIPQILAAAILGLLVRTMFHGHAIDALVLGGASMVVAAVLMLRVKDTPRPTFE
jgi:maltose/moltooligosaccharide transporter